MKFKGTNGHKAFKAAAYESKGNDLPQTVKLSKQERRNLNKKNKASVGLGQPSLAAKLAHNESVYKRETVYPVTITDIDGPWDRFVTPADSNLSHILKTSYDGFVVSKADQFKQAFHNDFRSAMEGLDTEGFYQFDITQPAGLGTKVARTFVTRCLVGDAGTTYKYLGLRMFSIPWDAENGNFASRHARTIGKLNQIMVQHSNNLLQRSGKQKVGSCQYNLTLINKCFPQDAFALKYEPGFEADKCSVSWHADSTLEHFSTIGVYHCTSKTTAVPIPTITERPRKSGKSGRPGKSENHPKNSEKSENPENPENFYENIESSEDKNETLDRQNDGDKVGDKGGLDEVSGEDEDDQSWRIALRVWYDAEGPNATRALSSRAAEMSAGSRIAPAVAVPLPSCAAYFLLDDFNHHHQHAVLAGNTYRYASTHRVCKTEGHTYQSIHAKCTRLLQVPKGSKLQFLSRNVRAEQMMQSELEFEWLRQFYIQGSHHYTLHAWWHEPMQELLRLWGEFQARAVLTLEVLRNASTFDYDSEFSAAPSDKHTVKNAGGSVKTPGMSHTSGEAGIAGEGDGEKRKDRKRWLKTLQRIECVDVSTYDAVLESLRQRHEKRVGWISREKDPIFGTLGPGFAPLSCPINETLIQCNNSSLDLNNNGNGTEKLPRVTSLLNLCECVEQWKKAFEKNQAKRK